jgi:deoxyribodipyrimidine photo-lyase
VPELAAIGDRRVHEPWLLDSKTRRALDYPKPIVDHARAAVQFLARRRATKNRLY